ncbi:MAG: hypothetical protein ABWW70_01410 [Thermoproteota archaeon]
MRGKVRSAVNRIAEMLRELKMFLWGAQEALRQQAVGALELEYLELEHAFLTMVLGALVGLPLAPLSVAAELAPLLEGEVKVLLERAWREADVISDLFSTMGGEW